MKNNLKLSLILFIFIISGCSVSFSTSTSQKDLGGLLKSINHGDTWEQKTSIPKESGKPGSFNGLNTNSMAIDPNDNLALYFGSLEAGLFYSYDGGNGWARATSLGNIKINSIAVDPKSKCIIYVSSGSKLYKTTDCNRSYTAVYYDNKIDTQINAIAINSYNGNILIGTSRGDLIISEDGGKKWAVANRFNNNIIKILIPLNGNKTIFVGTKDKGLFRSTDDGKTWEDLNENLKDFSSSKNIKDIAVSKSEKDLIIIATNYGLLRSRDNGKSWGKIELITPEKKATINSLVVSDLKSDYLYYVTETTYYYSLDGGKRWSTRRLPSKKSGWKLLVDPIDPNIVYVGVKQLTN